MIVKMTPQDLSDLILTLGARRYQELEGEPYSDMQLALLWKEQKVGEFGFRLMARVGCLGADRKNSGSRLQTLDAEARFMMFYIDNLLQGIASQLELIVGYRNIGMDFIPKTNVNHSAYLLGALRAFLPYVLPLFNSITYDDICKCCDWDLQDIGGFSEMISEVDPIDYPLIAKVLLQEQMEVVALAQNKSIVEGMLGSGMTEAVWWPETLDRINDVYARMMQDARARAGHYLLEGKKEASRVFGLYAGDDFASMLQDTKGMALGMGLSSSDPVEGIIKTQAVLTSVMFARPESYVTEIFQVLDDALDIVNARF